MHRAAMSASDWPDEQDPDDEDWVYDDDDDAETVPCPECGAEVYEEAESCPACGNYIVHSHTSASHNVWSDRPWWWTILGILGILLLIWALAAGV